MKCQVCGYKMTNEKERDLEERFGCARVLISKENDGYSTSILCCSHVGGMFYPPGSKPNEYLEDKDALKDGILEMKKNNDLKQKEALERFQKAVEERAKRLEGKDKKPKT